jgi:hypothetical protein
MSESIICVRAFEFGCRILKLAERLWNRGPAARHIATQLMGCGTSISAMPKKRRKGTPSQISLRN